MLDPLAALAVGVLTSLVFGYGLERSWIPCAIRIFRLRAGASGMRTKRIEQVVRRNFQNWNWLYLCFGFAAFNLGLYLVLRRGGAAWIDVICFLVALILAGIGLWNMASYFRASQAELFGASED